MDKLLPCPFCGGKAELINDDTTTYGFPTPNWAVHCVKEDCIGHDIEPRYSQMESAIEDWNRRPAPENKPQTNADRIRSMTDDELAALIVKRQEEDPSLNWCKDEFGCMDLGENFICTDKLETKCVVNWLQQPTK